MHRFSSKTSEAQTYVTDDEIEGKFAGMTLCFNALSIQEEWILDTGATDHMTPLYNDILKPVKHHQTQTINMPDGKTSVITFW